MPQPTSFNKALITGGHSGLGKALGDFLEAQNIPVIRTSSETHDLTTQEGIQGVIDLIEKEKPDLIVNNAGIGLYGPTLSHPISEELSILKVNIEALTTLTLHGAQTMTKGTILNISSAGAFFAYPTFNLYCASKAFVNSFSLALDRELKHTGIRVLCACPGQIATSFRTRAAKGHPQKTDRRTMTPEEAASHLWWQIQKGKPLHIFDWKTRWTVRLSKLFPRPLLEQILIDTLKSRYPQD